MTGIFWLKISYINTRYAVDQYIELPYGFLFSKIHLARLAVSRDKPRNLELIGFYFTENKKESDNICDNVKKYFQFR